GRQVADVAVRRQDLVVWPQVLVDGLGLGRALDDDDVHSLALLPGAPGDSARQKGAKGGTAFLRLSTGQARGDRDRVRWLLKGPAASGSVRRRPPCRRE